jgi:hypothetical protein
VTASDLVGIGLCSPTQLLDGTAPGGKAVEHDRDRSSSPRCQHIVLGISPLESLFSIRGGETLTLRAFGMITSECVSTFGSVEGIDILDGPPEVTLKFEPGLINFVTTGGKVCPKPLPGGNIMITASKDITEQMEANLTFRVRYKAKPNSSGTNRYHLLLFPAPSGGNGEQPATAKQ